MITDRQAKKLWGLLGAGVPLYEAALRTGMTEKTARRYRNVDRLPSELKRPHEWRTRQDPFEEVWPLVEEQLRLNPGLQAKTLMSWLQREHPGRFQDGQLRTLQRRIKQWRALEGPAKEVFFDQVHHPGDLCASDFTRMTSLRVTIQGQPLDHMVYHFVLTYSNWESVSLCYSESFESLCDGLQQALWKLGGVPRRHRTDRFSAAVNNLDEQQDFTQRYKGLMQHYRLEMEKIQAREPHENGDVESLHGKFKNAVDQALMLRGSRDFSSMDDYRQFLEQITTQRNQNRVRRFGEEQRVLRALPAQRFDGSSRCRVPVSSGSLIQVKNNTYSVHSRLVGETVEARVHADQIEIWFAQRKVDQFPRLRGRGKHQINFRHVIDWLVRKPGAFENYRYREDLFPNIVFRQTFDELCRRRSKMAAIKDYLAILHTAAYESESRVTEALRSMLFKDAPIDPQEIKQWVLGSNQAPPVTEVNVDDVNLSSFDCLLSNFSIPLSCDMEVTQ